MIRKLLKRRQGTNLINTHIRGNLSLFQTAKDKYNSTGLKLNIGCGTDYREGFINIDGSNELPRVDKIIDISKESLLSYFEPNSIKYILANDIIEHHYHWEAVDLLTQFYKLLEPGGICEIRVPDCDFIISTSMLTPERKLVFLFGGQDVPQGTDDKMDHSRKVFPQFFCHKYGWNMDRMGFDLLKIGFGDVGMKGAGTNFITIAPKS